MLKSSKDADEKTQTQRIRRDNEGAIVGEGGKRQESLRISAAAVSQGDRSGGANW